MKTKALEIRDKGTFIPVFAVQMLPDNEPQRYLLRRSGYGFDEPCVVVCRMSANGNTHDASYDPYCWGNSRTMVTAHDYITNHFDELEDGSVVDVEFIMGETSFRKVSEAQNIHHGQHQFADGNTES